MCFTAARFKPSAGSTARVNGLLKAYRLLITITIIIVVVIVVVVVIVAGTVELLHERHDFKKIKNESWQLSLLRQVSTFKEVGRGKCSGDN